jgi:hypothetical protein
MAPRLGVRGNGVSLDRGASLDVRGIDNFANGVATSIKSLDIFAKSYRILNNLASRISGYAQQLANNRGGSIPEQILRDS